MTDGVERRTLHDGWHVEARGGADVPAAVRDAGPVPATVPGVVHLDLMAAGLLADPYLGTNEALQGWVGRTSWRFTTEFDWQDAGAERVDLVLSGLDTVATVRLGDQVVLQARNQHRSWRVPVGHLLRPGTNRLTVDIEAPVPAADRASAELGYRPHVNHHPYNAIRKAACSFGWDWGPDTATSGIWRPVVLESWSTARLADVVLSPTVAGTCGVLDVRVTGQTSGDPERDTPLTVAVTVGGEHAEVALTDGAAHLTLRVPDVARWWPRGRGEQARYAVDVQLRAGGRVLDTAARRVGFRTVEVDTTPDAAGAPFTISVNGQALWVRGVNWIPDDAFAPRVDRARYDARLTQAVDANVDLVRVWGGGIFESEDFYDLADEKGLLVWQDFLLACAAYAEEEPLAGEIAAESREAVIRLGTHPSLVVLNGNNENLWGREEWGWGPRLDGRTWGAGYYSDLFPRLVAELAPHVAYTPGSPFSPDPSTPSNDPLHATTHLWELWNREDHPRYRDTRPRFVAEFGWQGPPTWSTLTRAVPDQPLTPESPGMLAHQKAADGTVKLIDGLVAHLRLPDTMPEWHWAMSLNQAVAVRTALEHFRALRPHCSGAIVWQLNDCWPVVSWAAVDGDGRKKPLWYALRDAFADRLATLQPAIGSSSRGGGDPRGAGLDLVVVNDGTQPWTAPVHLARTGFDGEVLAEMRTEVRVEPGGIAQIPLDPGVATPQRPDAELVRAVVGEAVAHWFFTEPREAALPPQTLTTAARVVAGGVEVTVTAGALVRDLALLPDVVDPAAEVDRMLLTLLPGEEVTFHVATTAGAAPEEFTGPAVVRTMNALVLPTR